MHLVHIETIELHLHHLRPHSKPDSYSSAGKVRDLLNLQLLLLLQAAGGAAAKGEGVSAGPEGHAAAESTRPGAGQSPTQATR